MARAWRRGISINNTTNADFGSVALTSINPGESILHSFWSFQCWGVWGSLPTFPIGSAILRAGLIVNDILATPLYPIFNAGDQWMDMCTVKPEGNIATSTNVDWAYIWSTGQSDRETTVHRKNLNISGTLGVWVNWEFNLSSDTVAGFAVGGWNASLDCYVDTP